jgi:nucleoside-diphosphate-sugar epimerase
MCEINYLDAGRASRFFLTGGTGLLGSHIGSELLRRGYKVTFLARRDQRLAAAERVDRVLRWHGADSNIRRGARVVEGEITKPGLGLETELRHRLRGKIDQIIHCASDTSFAERDREQLTRANVEGMRHLLDFAADSRPEVLHHLSTAYVAGRRTGLCREELVQGVAFHNVYEETKCLAEWLAWERCRAEGIRLTIYRPSIVYGHSQTGRTFRFNALYYPARVAHTIKMLYETDIHERGGARAKGMGVRLEPDGSLYLPVRIEVLEGCGLNLIPVDYFVAAFIALMQETAGGVYHIVNERVKGIEELIRYIATWFGLSGLQACPGPACDRSDRNALETLVDEYLAPYGPYMRDTRVFGTARAGPILDRRGIACPDLDYHAFSRCIDYAVQVGWKTNLEDQVARIG